MTTTLSPGQSLIPGTNLFSDDELYQLDMQTDGNVVLYDSQSVVGFAPQAVVWATHTNGTNGITPGKLIMQTDGNLVLYDSSGQPRWASQTSGNPGAFLILQNDGNLVLYRAGSTTPTQDNALWTSGTSTGGAIDINDVNYDQFDGSTDPRNIQVWIQEALAAAGLPDTDGWMHGFLTLCSRESSYNPNAVNITDGNATGPIVGDGNPQGCSRGIAQTTPGTFASYHVAGTRTKIYDPVANIAAASLYVRSSAACGPVSEDGSDFADKVQQANPNKPPHGYCTPPDPGGTAP